MEINKALRVSVARTMFSSLCSWSPWLGSYVAPVGGDGDGHGAEDEDRRLFFSFLFF